eukprot:GHVR01155664.1.p2 GENE.GHVR01155664.1~~GHVR01155664.1.p2  ORF type:complete len:105 (-),score=4.95 GHVR01155664.1:501-815(-)
MIKEAQIDSANEPNRSAPIPATSPTLSPIVAGFLGLSYGRPAYNFPTKSDPKSAALVKIPPPTRANNATKPKSSNCFKKILIIVFNQGTIIETHNALVSEDQHQ